MKSVFLASAAALFLLSSSLVVAERARPDVPEIPSGADSDLAVMVEGQKSVKAFVAASDAYLECLTEEDAKMAGTYTDEEKETRMNLHNASVDAQTAVATKFNEEIRAYKAKKP